MTNRELENLVGDVESNHLLSAWTHFDQEASQTLVIPDGCQDVIVELDDEAGNRCFVSPLGSASYSVEVSSTASMFGFRLKPGTKVNHKRLLEFTERNDPLKILEQNSLDEMTDRSSAIAESLECVGSGLTSIAACSKELGVSVRTLQRLIKQETGVSPMFWLSLSRVRRTCRSLHQFDKLADAADCFGYSDQSHMTRDVRRWFGTTPTAVVPESELYSRLGDSGYF